MIPVHLEFVTKGPGTQWLVIGAVSVWSPPWLPRWIYLAGLVLRDEGAFVGWADGGSHSGFRIQGPVELGGIFPGSGWAAGSHPSQGRQSIRGPAKVFCWERELRRGAEFSQPAGKDETRLPGQLLVMVPKHQLTWGCEGCMEGVCVGGVWGSERDESPA